MIAQEPAAICNGEVLLVTFSCFQHPCIRWDMPGRIRFM